MPSQLPPMPQFICIQLALFVFKVVWVFFKEGSINQSLLQGMRKDFVYFCPETSFSSLFVQLKPCETAQEDGFDKQFSHFLICLVCGNFGTNTFFQEVTGASTGKKKDFQRIVSSSRQPVCMWEPKTDALLCPLEEEPEHGFPKCKIKIMSNVLLMQV